jgi:type I restriction enzyme S subunit
MKLAEGILPAGWIGLTLEDVAQIHDNLREPVNSSERAKRPGPYPYYGATGQVGWIDDFRQDGEYVLLGEDGAPFFEPTKEKAYLVSGKCWVNNHAHVLNGQEGLCSNRYLLYALNQTNYRGYANGTTRLKLTQSAMRQLPINLAPVAEQNRIVAKVEELFSELDKGIENLKTARAQLKVYRQALLKHAFEGKLTAQWRAERNANATQTVIPAQAGIQPLNDMDSRLRGNDEMGDVNDGMLETADALLKRIQQERAQRYQQQLAVWQATGGSKPKAPKPLPPLTAEELAELPEGWGWVLIDVLLSLEKKPMATGPFGTLLSKSDHKSSGMPVLGIENIGNGKFVVGNKIFVSKQKAEELESFGVESGDIVISRSGTVGEICKIPEGLGKAFISTNLIRVSLNTNVINQDYFVYLFQGGGSVKQQVKHLCKGSSREFLNQTILSAISFPLPSIDEQRQIVDAIDAKFSIIEKLENTIGENLQQAEALRQSILKKAFSGQLVPQDPHDEPASALLARIKAERAEVVAKPRKNISSKLVNAD